MVDTKIGIGPEQQNEDKKMIEFMRSSGMNQFLDKADLDAGFYLKAPFKLDLDDIDVITGQDGLKKLEVGDAMFVPRMIVQVEGNDGKIYSVHLNEDKEGKLAPTAYEVREKTTEEGGQILDTRDQIASGLS